MFQHRHMAESDFTPLAGVLLILPTLIQTISPLTPERIEYHPQRNHWLTILMTKPVVNSRSHTKTAPHLDKQTTETNINKTATSWSVSGLISIISVALQPPPAACSCPYPTSLPKPWAWHQFSELYKHTIQSYFSKVIGYGLQNELWKHLSFLQCSKTIPQTPEYFVHFLVYHCHILSCILHYFDHSGISKLLGKCCLAT